MQTADICTHLVKFFHAFSVKFWKYIFYSACSLFLVLLLSCHIIEKEHAGMSMKNEKVDKMIYWSMIYDLLRTYTHIYILCH